ncbi:MAG TPA: CHAD domain-containing protein [Pseudonocardia sp.]
MTATTGDKPAKPAPRPSTRRSKADSVAVGLLKLPEPLKAAAGDSPVQHVRVALDTRLRALLRHDPGARTGEDVEDVHQMRVSVRRMRAALAAARPLLDRDWSNELRAELGWLGRSLGPVRDLDVMLPRLRHLADGLPADERGAAERLIATLDGEYAEARREMLFALGAPRYTALLERLADAVRLPLPTPSATEDSPELVELVRGEYTKLRKAVRKAGQDPPDVVLHALRIKCKRLRYTGELAEPALGKPVRRLLAATTGLQEILGDHQDACVTQERIRELVAAQGETPDPTLVFVAGRLVEREHVRAEQLRTQWRAAWDKVEVRARKL